MASLRGQGYQIKAAFSHPWVTLKCLDFHSQNSGGESPDILKPPKVEEILN